MSHPPPAKPPTARERFCFNCGASLGVIETRLYDSRDTCGALACEREARAAHQQEREEAHRELDERNGWGDYYGRY